MLEVFFFNNYFLLCDVVRSYCFTFFFLNHIFLIFLNFSYILSNSSLNALVIILKTCCRFSDRIFYPDSGVSRFSEICKNFIFSHPLNHISKIYLLPGFFPDYPRFPRFSRIFPDFPGFSGFPGFFRKQDLPNL